MSSTQPSTQRRGTLRSSHLRHVSHGSTDLTYASRPVTPNSSTGTVRHDLHPPKLQVERRCTLWVHDEAFSKDEVVLNLDLFPEFQVGELMAIAALKTDIGVRDFQDKAQGQDSEMLGVSMHRDRSNSKPRRPSEPNGVDANHSTDLGRRYLFMAKNIPKELKSKHPNLEISVARHIADVFCLRHRSNVLISTVDSSTTSASHVELSFKDEYLARSDMWRLVVGELSNKAVYRGQKILFLGTVKAQVTAVFVNGHKVQSAFFSINTKPIFRSESARYVLFIQMSREMWDFDSEGSGEIMFNKVVNGFLPALFKKWASMKAKHLVSIVLFTRVEYDTGLTSELAASVHDSAYHTGIQADANKKPYKDFYRVVVSEMASGEWTTILYQLKREFKFFRKDISMHRISTISKLDLPPTDGVRRGARGTRIEAEPSLAMHGNVLEAINLASSQFSHDHIDRDLMRTGISVVVVTPSVGLFEVDYETLRMTTETLIGNGIGIDLVCLPKMPLHSVPLFRYRNPQYAAFQEALHLKSLLSGDSTPRQATTAFGSFSSINGSLSPLKTSLQERSQHDASDLPGEWSYAIPHWIDVSFWTGASQDLPLISRPPEPVLFLKTAMPRRPSDFAVRCKMYEMEMASAMENTMTEISVSPLQNDPLFPKMVLGPRKLSVNSQDQGGNRSVEVLERERVYTSLLEFISGQSKHAYDRNASQSEKNFYKTLDRFDLAHSELLEGGLGGRKRNDSRRFFKIGSEEAVKRVLAEDLKLLSTKPDEDGIAFKGLSMTGTATSSRPKSNSRASEEPAKSRKESISSFTVASSRVSPVRLPKIGRQISLGKHGFGIAAPKVALAELHTEHASATKPATVSSKVPESKKKSSATMANHLLGIPPANRPSSSNSEKAKSKLETQSADTKSIENEDGENTTSSKPILIKNAIQALDSSNQFKSRSVLGSQYEGVLEQADGEDIHTLQSMKLDDTQKLFNSKLLAGSVPELPATLSPTTALSPWLSVLNPSNPTANELTGPNQYRRWQHVFPRPVLVKTMKWKSLCCPASVPLTTEYFPTKYQLDTEYQQKPYNISQNAEDELNEVPKTRDEFLRELIALRLTQGFQVVIGPAVAEAFGQKSMKIAEVFDQDRIAEDGASVFMSMGNTIHQLSCVNGTEIEVNMYIRKPTAFIASSPGVTAPTVYNPAIRTILADEYLSRKILLERAKDDYNWNYVDSFIAGFEEEMTEHLRFWRARFVLIPVERPTQSQRRLGEDNEEEIRLEGIKKLTQMWQRHRYISSSERRFQNLGSRKAKDPNPLDIVYKTEDPSVVVSAELETLPLVETGEPSARRGQLLETERFRKAKLDIASLAEAIQAPVEKGGVRMQNRRWHFRLHYNCFIGSDMTTWLLDNFEDIDDREDAVDFGNMLMADEQFRPSNGKDKDMGIFVHVEKRHPFRDGQYFYQVTGDFAKQRPESRSGWFPSRRRDTSVPSTPMSESMRESPRPERSRSSSNNDEKESDSGTTTPITSGGLGKKPKVALSKVMKYDVDHRKRSYRPERINLHYDRLHNPDNCYHIRIDWMSVTAKLIEDAIESWAATAELYGLRLVDAPIGEACSITSIHPFRSPYIIELAVRPPEQQPRTYFDVSSFSPQVQSNRHYYQKAIMKKFNFVLDIESARNFPRDVDVTYSWGRPDYKYTQYIHRSGVLLAQITDEGNILLLANRLYNNRTAAARDPDRYVKIDHGERGSRISSTGYNHNLSSDKSPYSSPMLRPTHISSPMLRPIQSITPDIPIPPLQLSKPTVLTAPETIKNEIELFCHDAAALDAFYKEVFEKATLPSATPPNFRSPYVPTSLDSSIPTLGLPPGVLARDSSPAPLRQAASPLLRRTGSVQSVSSSRNGQPQGVPELRKSSPKLPSAPARPNETRVPRDGQWQLSWLWYAQAGPAFVQ
ncbi:hypothetical protein B7494_g4723 [Chlorociboria aeruginascens]|nr:hypothetical protein B7494_g4723 [Chlorociboria aeruginascens]